MGYKHHIIPTLVAFFLGICLCLYVSNGKQSKEIKGPPVYLLADVDIHDNQTFAEYAKKSQDIIKKYGGRYLIRGGKIDHMEGKWPLERVILLEFNDIEKLNECFNSPEYLQIKPIRERSSSSKAVILQGIGANKNSF